MYEELTRLNLWGRVEVDIEAGSKIELAESLPWIKLPFKEAIAAFRKKTRVVTQKAFKKLSEALKAKSFTIAGEHRLHSIEKGRESLERAIATGVSKSRWIREARKNGIAGLGNWHLDVVFDTNVFSSYQHGRYEQQKRTAKSRPILVYRTMGDERVRETHAMMEGFTAHRDHPAWATWYPLNGYKCFLPGTMIEGSFQVGLKSRYAGAAVEIETARGNRLSVTANHPVLTSAGWVNAHVLKKGDTLLSYKGEIKSSLVGDIGNENAPARVEDVFEAIMSKGSGPSTIKLSSLDFYGDGRNIVDGKVNVVFADRKLLINGNTESTECIDKQEFIGSDSPTAGASAVDHCRTGGVATPGSTPRFSSLASKDLGVVGSRPSNAPFESLSFGSAPKFDSIILEKSIDGWPTDPEFFGEIQDASAGEIVCDDIIRVRKFNFTGHVYDFQSVNGWILAQNICTSNCRCRVEAKRASDVGSIIPNNKSVGIEPDEGWKTNPGQWLK